MSSSKLRGIVWLCLGIVIAGVFAAGLSYSIAQIPWSYEKKLASKLGLPTGELVCPKNAALTKLVARIYPIDPEDQKFDIDVKVLRGDVVNAFAFVGGQIFIYEGLLREAESADEIAGILAHEIAHVSRRDVLQGLATRLLTLASLQMIFGSGSDSGLLNYALNMRFTRTQEKEADEAGLKRLKVASVNPLGLANFFDRLEKLSTIPGFLSDHPPGGERAVDARKILVENPIEILSREEWLSLKKVCHD